jgi:hypothetical protein
MSPAFASAATAGAHGTRPVGCGDPVVTPSAASMDSVNLVPWPERLVETHQR